MGITAGSREVPGRNAFDKRHPCRMIIIIIIIAVGKYENKRIINNKRKKPKEGKNIPPKLQTQKTFISVINQIDAQNVCFTISLFHASTCFEHMCSSSGGQNCITQPLSTRARDGNV